MIEDITKIDLETIDMFLELSKKVLAKLPSLTIGKNAKHAWQHEMEASSKRLLEIRPGYLDGRTTARHPKDQTIMLMHVSLVNKFVKLVEAMERT